MIIALLTVAIPLPAQQPPDSFHWIDFHSAKDSDTAVWITRSLAPQKWTAIREIGVEYDAALVVTTLRSTPQAPPLEDTFTVWSASLTSHVVAPVLKGVHLRLLNWTLFAASRPPELAALYDDCTECQPATYFTAFHYDLDHHQWIARWKSGPQAAPVWSSNTLSGVVWSQVYALLTDEDGSHRLGTWSHFDYGSFKPAVDSVYFYDVNPENGQDRTTALDGAAAAALEKRLCLAQNAVPGLQRGQDTAVCKRWTDLPARKPVTTPPANNQGQSQPPGAKH